MRIIEGKDKWSHLDPYVSFPQELHPKKINFGI
jgi:hypothetical protein